MTLALLRLLEHIHGHLGWLAVAALLHPAIILRRPTRRAPLAVSLATGLVLLTGALGATVYPDYRVRLKQNIFLEAPTLGWCFERKEHLAVFAISFACIGCLLHLTTPRFTEPLRPAIAKTAHRAYVGAFAMALMTAILGIAVAVHSTF
ncbi:hypothetical protein BH09MYX1_BH09MYX1_20000 [soil metagenome]